MNKNKYIHLIKTKKIFQQIIYGLLLGVSDGIPGYSGGTTLSLFNSYEQIMFGLKKIFIKNNFNNWFKNVIWLLPFLISWLLSLIGFSFITSKISHQGLEYQSLLIIIFLIFSFFSIFNFFFKNLYKDKKIYISNSKKYKYILTMLSSFLIMISVGIGVYFSGGINLNKEIVNNKINIDIRFLLIIFTCFLSGYLMLFPGISGSLILLMANTYKDVYWVILQNPIENILPLFLVLLSLLLGIISEIFTINFLIKKWSMLFLWLSFGFVLGSPIAMILAFIGNKNYLISIKNTFLNKDINMIVILVTLTIIFIINLLLTFFFIRKRKLKIYSNSALLIIDMQNDFYINGSLEVPHSNEIVKNILSYIRLFQSKKQKIIFTKDVHPKNHVSFNKWKPHCVKGTKGCEIIDELKNVKMDSIIEKGTNKDIENYSAFYNGQYKSKLEEYLIKNNIFNVYVVGIAGDYCVKETAIDLIKNKYNVILLSDSIKSMDNNFNIYNINSEITIL